MRFPTVSLQPKHVPDIQRCARWLAVHLRKIGLESARLFGTSHPIVYAASRVSGHSRGAFGLRELLPRGFLRGTIDRVVVLDASDAFRSVSVAGALRTGGASAGRIISYAVNLGHAPGAVNVRLGPLCVRAIGYTRLVLDAMITRPYVASTLPGVICRQLLPLPPRGILTTSSTSRAGDLNIRTDCRPRIQTCFCAAQKQNILKIVAQENHRTLGLRTFIENNNLTRFCQSFLPGIYSHHMFVAEIAYELFA